MNKKTITIIFRATDFVFGVHAKKRYYSTNKTEITKTCFLSLYNSCLLFKDRINFVILGDRMSDDLTNFFNKFNVTIFEKNFSRKAGLRESIQAVLDIAYTCQSDWVWIQEDDYLFVEDTLLSMIELIDSNIVKILNKENLIIFPTDYDIYYSQSRIFNQSYVISLENRHWRSISNTTFSVCVESKFLRKNKENFDQMFLDIKYKRFDTYVSKFILQQTENLVLSPIPSLSAHLDENVKLPFTIDWKSIWDNHFSKITEISN